MHIAKLKEMAQDNPAAVRRELAGLREACEGLGYGDSTCPAKRRKRRKKKPRSAGSQDDVQAALVVADLAVQLRLADIVIEERLARVET